MLLSTALFSVKVSQGVIEVVMSSKPHHDFYDVMGAQFWIKKELKIKKCTKKQAKSGLQNTNFNNFYKKHLSNALSMLGH